jgi:hypothetical protein
VYEFSRYETLGRDLEDEDNVRERGETVQGKMRSVYRCKKDRASQYHKTEI